jgi:hypothetical protein
MGKAFVGMGYKRAGRVVVVVGLVLAWELARYILAGLTNGQGARPLAARQMDRLKRDGGLQAGRKSGRCRRRGLGLGTGSVYFGWLDDMDKERDL